MTSETRCWCGHHKRYHGGDSCTFCDKRQLNEPHSFGGVVTRTQGGVAYKSLEAPMEGGAFGDVPFPKQPRKKEPIKKLPYRFSQYQPPGKVIPYRPEEFSETVTEDDVLEAERAIRARSNTAKPGTDLKDPLKLLYLGIIFVLVLVGCIFLFKGEEDNSAATERMETYQLVCVDKFHENLARARTPAEEDIFLDYCDSLLLLP